MSQREPSPCPAPPGPEPSAAAGEFAQLSPAEFHERLRARLLRNLEGAYAPSAAVSAADAGGESARQARVEAGLVSAQARVRLLPAAAPVGGVVRLLDTRSGAITEYGCLIGDPAAAGRHDPPVDWNLVIDVLAAVPFVEHIFYKVERLTVLCADPPAAESSRRRFQVRPLPSGRLELRVQGRYLQELTPAREARLYRAVTPRGEIRRDRNDGARSWPRARLTEVAPAAPPTGNVGRGTLPLLRTAALRLLWRLRHRK